MALLTKWIDCIIFPEEILVTQTLRDNYSIGADWDCPTTSFRGVPLFGMDYSQRSHIFKAFSLPSLGMDPLFNSRGMIGLEGTPYGMYPPPFSFFALVLNSEATVVDYWDNSWCPILVGHLSDQWVEDLTALQQSLLHLRLDSGAPDGWVWRNHPFSTKLPISL